MDNNYYAYQWHVYKTGGTNPYYSNFDYISNIPSWSNVTSSYQSQNGNVFTDYNKLAYDSYYTASSVSKPDYDMAYNYVNQVPQWSTKYKPLAYLDTYGYSHPGSYFTDLTPYVPTNPIDTMVSDIQYTVYYTNYDFLQVGASIIMLLILILLFKKTFSLFNK